MDEQIHRSVEVWVALDDTDEINGQLWMVPGSHPWIPTLRGIHAFPFPFARRDRAHHRRHAVPVPVRRGQAVVFNHAIAALLAPQPVGSPRLVAIDDLIPEEAQHLHYFGDGAGRVDVLRDRRLVLDRQQPVHPVEATASQRPVSARSTSTTGSSPTRTSTSWCAPARRRDRPAGRRRAQRGQALVSSVRLRRRRRRPDRWIGNVTMLCEPCRDAEARRAPSPSHVGG